MRISSAPLILGISLLGIGLGSAACTPKNIAPAQAATSPEATTGIPRTSMYFL